MELYLHPPTHHVMVFAKSVLFSSFHVLTDEVKNVKTYLFNQISSSVICILYNCMCFTENCTLNYIQLYLCSQY
jgi:hypothetical protein